MHDEAGQLLTALLVGLRTLEDARKLADVKVQGHRLREITAQAIDEVGRLARGLHPTVLDDHGLGVALSRYVAEYTKTHNIAVDLTLNELDSSNLPSAVQIALYRILQEALTNVARHSGAKSVSIRFARSATALEVAVIDDGCGFDAEGRGCLLAPPRDSEYARESGNVGRNGQFHIPAQGNQDSGASPTCQTRTPALSGAEEHLKCRREHTRSES